MDGALFFVLGGIYMEIAVIEKMKRSATLPFVKREVLNPRLRFLSAT
jgi:hypothetical protein